MLEWLQIEKNTMEWIAGASILIFFAFLVVILFWAVRIPPDYFAYGRSRRMTRADCHFIPRTAFLIGKNLLGYFLFVAGIVILVLPGQRILMILAGIMLLDFPGKYRLVRLIVAYPLVIRTLNWLRRLTGRSPLYIQG